MGKYLNSAAARLGELSQIVSSAKPQRPKGTVLHKSPNRVAANPPRTANPIAVKVEQPANKKKMEPLEEQQCRTPLAKVVADCAKRWFQDTLKEAKAGDIAMQVLVGQMYHSGYGVRRDAHKGMRLLGLLNLAQLANKTVTSFVCYWDLFGLVKPQEIEVRFGKCAPNGRVMEQVIQIHVNWRAKINLFLNLQVLQKESLHAIMVLYSHHLLMRT